ncbi:ribosomal protein S5 domain 2-type protein [Dunaliella salina]|uniref:Ribosomal protein S5 domain 2-type protein n=1 Tax=Dunaliella salina TaxID=3046 RepID=A0ABQ7GW89_DUNSA|nr:ribosomal protein S5 domain 2-type protein [Dunaliella salina]|eukprot:KAF5838871.1 ribosomal protein S5 domain 2-type protein [Dunaliella salina]
MAGLVPVQKQLADSYGPAAGELESRYEQLRSAFSKTFHAEPECFARAPGRVNLIGEHIDYEGYGVLPMAIKQDTIVAVKKGGDKLVISNVDGNAYKTQTFETDPKQEVDVANHSWANYFMCAYKGAFELLEAKHSKVPEPCGLQIMVHGVVPLGGGLSSSAALVCSSMLAVLAAHGITADKSEVAEFAAKAERYVGVTSGGMDQAISMMGMLGVAKLIEFNPVRASDVVLPPNAVFVVANSLAVSNKAEAAPRRYNLRVVECRLAAIMMTLALGATPEASRSVQTLKDVEPKVAESLGSPGLDACLEAVHKHLHEAPYTHDELETALGVPLDSLYTGSPASLKVLQVAREGGGFKLRQRAEHVFEEEKRVLEFKAVCDGSASADDKLASLARIMNASHESCVRLYECSCPELEELTTKAKEAGALSSRLTGAGWGGCTVSLLAEGRVDEFLQSLRNSFYQSRISSGHTKEEDMPKVLFASKPSSGAAVLQI